MKQLLASNEKSYRKFVKKDHELDFIELVT